MSNTEETKAQSKGSKILAFLKKKWAIIATLIIGYAGGISTTESSRATVLELVTELVQIVAADDTTTESK